ncbi:MAG: hypothetical protein ACE5G1_11285 [bacterium]
MGAFIKFNKGLMQMPGRWQLWLMLLIAVNLAVPLFFLERLEARIVVGTLLASMMLTTVLTHLSGFTRLLGLGHVFWFPMLYFLWTRLGQIPADDFFGIWIRVLMTLNTLSLVIDVADVSCYIAGDRAETVQGL